MLQEELAPSHRRRFLNLSTGECIKVDLLELRDHNMLAVTPEGLLVLLHRRTYLRLLNPLTRRLAELPPLATLLPPGRRSYLSRVTDPYLYQHLRAWGSGVLNDSSIVLCFHVQSIIGVARPGDECWTSVQYECPIMPTALVFSGRFYYVAKNSRLMVLETSGNEPPRMEVAANLCRPLSLTDSAHLADNGGELIVVHRTLEMDHLRSEYQVYRLDLNVGKLFPVKSFNGRALFVARNCSFSVSTKAIYASIPGDTIYFSLDAVERVFMQMEAYRLADGDVIRANYILDSCMTLPRPPHTLVDCLSGCYTDRKNIAFKVI
jgi:hypothetical protein